MARVRFDAGGQDVCPICYLSGIPDPADVAASALALGTVSAIIAESPLELGELMASACPSHQDRIAQMVQAWARLSGADARMVFERLGARSVGPPPGGTVIHLAHGEHTRCGRRRLADGWPDNERFVYEDRAHVVSCRECREFLGRA